MTQHHDPTPAEIEAEIERHRAHLADTVDQLAARLDVKSRARAGLAGLQDRATTDQGRPRPELLAVAAATVALLVVLAVRRHRQGGER